MWTSPDEARSDFILAAAAALFAPLILELLWHLLPAILRGRLGGLLQLLLLFAAYALVPLLLARYRGNGIHAFGLDTTREGLLPGLLLAVPVIALGVVVQLGLSGVSPFRAVLGNLNQLVGPPLDVGLRLLGLVAAFAWNLLLWSFLTVKARDAFARNEVPQVEALRTFGMGAAGGALLVGLFASITPGLTLLRAMLDVGALVALVLLTDRFVTPGATTSRATVLAPAIVALLVRVELFSSAFLETLRQSFLAAGVVVVVAVLIESRRYAWATVPLFGALVVYGTALRPI